MAVVVMAMEADLEGAVMEVEADSVVVAMAASHSCTLRRCTPRWRCKGKAKAELRKSSPIAHRSQRSRCRQDRLDNLPHARHRRSPRRQRIRKCPHTLLELLVATAAWAMLGVGVTQICRNQR